MINAADTAQLRQGLYRFFGGALISLDRNQVATLVDAGRLLGEFDLESFAYFGQWQRLMTALAELTPVESLESEYVRLFASGVSRALCPPVESFYLAEAKGGGIADLVSRIEGDYRALGLAPVRGSEPPDHVATECEVMSALCSREASAWGSGSIEEAQAALADQERFLRGHLAVWLPEFRGRVQRAEPAPFYAALLEAAHAFVVHDLDLIRAIRRASEAAS